MPKLTLTFAAILASALVVLFCVGFIAWKVNEGTRNAQEAATAKVEASGLRAETKAASAAVATIDNHAVAAEARATDERQALDQINKAEGAHDAMGATAAAGARGLCDTSTYRNHAKCLRKVHP